MWKWFKDMRLSQGLTQKDIASMADADVTTINKIELGKRRPSPELAKKIAAVMGFEWTRFYEKEKQTL